MDKRFGLKTHCVEDIIGVLRLQPEVEEALIFGSRAMGNYKNGSDIDIALKGEKINFDTVSTIRIRLDELPYLYMYDVIDYKKISNPAVTAHIDELGIVFYKKQGTPSEWKTYKLGEIAEIQTGPFGSQLHQSDYVDVGTPIITVEHLGENRILHSNLPRINEEDRVRLKKYWLKEDDIVFSRVGSVDRRAYVKKDEDGWLFSGRCLRVRPTNKVNGKFLSYFFGMEDFKSKIRAVAVGATMPSLNTSIMKDIEVSMPESLETQKQIAQILSSLDDKIELNLQMNQTLEAMAQAIFKEWFVDFNFPGFDGELVDGLPNGWRMGKLSEEFNLIMGQSPPGSSYNEIGDGMIFYQGRTDFGFRFPSNRLYTTEPKRIAEPLDTLISVRAPVGDINMAIEKCCIGRGLSAVRHKTNAYSFTYYMMKNVEPVFRGFEGEGTVFGSINKTNFENIEIVIPDKNVIQMFETITNQIDNKILENTFQIKSLTQTRDTLLPKLMSGQLEVKD